MKQLIQNVARGKAAVVEVPAPRAARGQVLVRVAASLVSAGTERSVVEFAEKNLVQKAMARPDLVRQVVQKASREGILTTFDAVRRRLDTDMALGYSNAGSVIAVGEDVTRFKSGDPVACAGGNYASHAEVVRVPQNLVAKISSEKVTFEAAAFGTVGAIALHGVRLAQPQLGETVAVVGLGLIGLIAVQLAKASGCDVVGMDINGSRCELAEQLGCDAAARDAEQMKSLVATRRNGTGADVVLIAAATSSSEPVQLAAEIARDRARVVAIGAVGMEIPRKAYYEKELSFCVSRAYGPGRYDAEYEEKGHDYPLGYVRWTEGRNLQAVLQMMAAGKLNVERLITHRVPIAEGERAYELISGKTGEAFLGVILTYPEQSSVERLVELTRVELTDETRSAPLTGSVGVGLIGAGNFASAVLVPALKQVHGVELVGVAAGNGVNARNVGTRFGFRYCTTEAEQIFSDSSVNTVVIATRHNQHARQVIAALEAGKHVFCEKPLCITEAELDEVARAYEQARRSTSRPMLMVGFNRRFASLARELKTFVSSRREPLVAHYRVNAGYLPPTHWTQDTDEGGGRIVGELCHFVDFLAFIVGRPIVAVQAASMDNAGRYCDDNVTAVLRFEDGSIGSITYVANGDRAQAKEYVEVFCGGMSAVLDDFRTLTTWSNGRKKVSKLRLRQDKGHQQELESFVDALRAGGPPPISFEQIVNTTKTTFKIVEAIRSGAALDAEFRRIA